MHNINTRNKHNLHRPNVNKFCSQESIFSAGIKIFNSLSPSLPVLKNGKAKFKAALRNIYIHTHSFYFVEELFMCKDDL